MADDPFRPLNAKPSKPPGDDSGGDAEDRMAIMPVPDDAPKPDFTKIYQWPATTVRPYKNAAGKVIFYQFRVYPLHADGAFKFKPDGKREKMDRYYVYSSHKGVRTWSVAWRSIPRPRPIYRQNFLAENPSDPVIICEGEKAADAVSNLIQGWQSTSWMGGASSAKHADVRPLIGRTCLVWPDNDEAGAKAGREMLALLGKVGAARIKIVNLGCIATHLGHPLKKGFDADDLLTEEKYTTEKMLVLMSDPEFAIDLAEYEDADQGAGHRLLVERLSDRLYTDGVRMNAAEQWCDDKWNPAPRITSKTVARKVAFDFRLSWGHFSTDHICETLQEIGTRMGDERRAELVSRFINRDSLPEAKQTLINYITAMCGEPDQLSYHCVRQLIWNVKRSMVGLPRSHELMVIAVGPQGSGKTTAIAKLCSPLCELAQPIQAGTLVRPEEAMILGRVFLGVWDEMEGAAKAEMEAIKNAITCATKTTRVFHTQDHATVVRTMSFIGTSNKPIGQVIRDTTGIRRFAQLDTVQRLDWDAINAIDYDLLWRCVSERDPEPIQPVLDELAAKQAGLIHKDTVRLWIEDEHWGRLEWTPVPASPSVIVMEYNVQKGDCSEDIRSRYLFWCRINGEMAVPGNMFFQRLEEEKFTWRREREGARRLRYYRRPVGM